VTHFNNFGRGSPSQDLSGQNHSDIARKRNQSERFNTDGKSSVAQNEDGTLTVGVGQESEDLDQV